MVLLVPRRDSIGYNIENIGEYEKLEYTSLGQDSQLMKKDHEKNYSKAGIIGGEGGDHHQSGDQR